MTAAKKSKTHGGASSKSKNRVAADAKHGPESVAKGAPGRVLFSFIVPVFASSQSGYFEVSRCLKSIMDQTVKGWEIIVLCDGSDDTMRAVVEGAQSEDNRALISYYELPHRGIRGGHHMISFGTDRAKGEFVCILNGDNWIEPDYIENMYHEDADIVTGQVEMHDLPGIILTGSSWTRGRMDRLNYAVRRSIASRVPHDQHIDADYDWFVSCYDYATHRHGKARFRVVSKLIGHHK